MSKRIFIALTSLMLSFATFTAHALDLKIATLAPQGSSLHKGLLDAANAVKAQTGGRVSVTLFAGGVQGDEKDVVRKMRYDQLQGAALTGVGLGLIEPSIRVLELPFLFSDNSQADKVYAGMRGDFEKAFSAKGFQLLGWAEVGFVKIFSTKPISKKADLQGMKMWMWEGDPLAAAMYKALGVTPVPLAITDVLTSLQTGLIDAAYAPELGAIGFQWHTKIKDMTDVNLVDGTGAIVLTQKAWSTIPASDQAIVRRVFDDAGRKLVAQSRADNMASKSSLQQFGIQIITPDAASIAEFKAAVAGVPQQLVGSLYSQDVLNKVLSLLK